MTLTQLNDKVQSFDVIKEYDAIIQNISPEIIDLNTSQLQKGILSTGERITPEYANKSYAEYKKSIGTKTGLTPDLKVTGDFYSGFNVQKRNNNWEVDSSDSKTDKLATKYSENIFGLTKENTSEIIDEFLKPRLTKALQDIL